MSPPSARPFRPALAVACLLAGAVGVAAAHPIVLLEDRSLEAESGGTVEVPLAFHDVDRATLTVSDGDGFELAATVVDSDRDGSVTVALDTAAVGRGNATAALSAEGGAVRNATVEDPAGGALPPGEYTVTVAPPNGGRDEGTLRVTSVERTGASAGSTSSDEGPTETATTAPASTGTSAAADGPDWLPWPPNLLLALFGPAVPVVALAGASRLGGE
ncbi:DUF7827 domain-containing protein [Halorarum salinum]|uniref:DUF7827 domain-containing protein n=1 Tax=Halorarum salinum TaxID=2743089 RepID=A0A7D5L8T1_9EURY|nr:hypothetical protein [Halobaculum salinum]QLG60631.1 hypothetical protein HUG12_02270 [Halobaculum salinum]